MYSILIVEDENILRKGLIASIDFEQLNCILIGEAADGEEGVKKIQELRPDIVITDLMMPLLSGLEMIEQTLECDYSSIIISGHGEFSLARQAIHYGVSEYLLKPVNPVELNEIIKDIIAQRKIKEKYEVLMKQRGEIDAVQLLSEFKSNDALIEGMFAFVSENYMNKITMEDVSRSMNYSESLLTKRFKKETNFTFNNYLNRFRIQKAMGFIKEGNFNLNDVAASCGFNDYKYFVAVFKKYLSCSPKQFAEIVHNQEGV